MKRHFALVAVLVLLLLPFLNPFPYSMPLAIVYESNEKPFFAAADGDESSESITSFSETLDDDVLFYPDAFDESTIDLADDGGSIDPPLGSGAGSSGDHTDTFVLDGVAMYDVSSTDDMEIWVNFTVPTGDYEINGFTYALYYKGKKPDITVHLYDYTAGDWGAAVDTQTNDNTYKWANGSCYDSDFWNTEVAIEVHGTFAPSISQAFIDYAEVTWSYMHLADSDHYAESFADVSDWTTSGNEAEDLYSTDGDIGKFEANWAGGTDYDQWYAAASMSGSYYFEMRYRTNQSNPLLYMRAHEGATPAGAHVWDWTVTQTGGAWKTIKILKSGTMGNLIIRSRLTSYNSMIEVEYIRLADETEMGWQHDCSTTEGVTDGGGGSSSSDGDELTLTADADGSTFEFAIDTTATAAYLDADYYPMIGLDFNDADSADYVKVESYDGSAWATVIANTTIGTDTLYANCRAADADIEKFRISVNPSANPRLKWFKAFSIANFTVTQFNSEIDDVLYVSDGHLYCENDGDSGTDYLQIEYDPALSVSDTYSVWNLTISNIGSGTGYSYDYGFRDDTWGTWYFDTTRGPTPSGTMDDFKVIFYDEVTVSAIKFIEDGTAPDILDKFVTPFDPNDDESVTITAVTFDAVEVHEVTLNAVVYPAGFSDVDYDLTEQTTDVLWSYEFSTLTAGYYLFQVTANDGANTYSEYIPVTVRVSEIVIDTYTFFGASSDFSFMQYSGYISHDCTYNISEWSASWPVNETHTGSVSAGMFNIAWDKIGVDDLEANFTIVFVNGSLSKTVPGYYGTAYKELRITEIKVHNPEESQAITNITVNFYTNKDIDWFVYDVDDSDAVLASGSSVEGSDVLRWLKDRTPFIHNYAIKWTDGVSNIWRNGSYWTYRENIDSIDQPGKDWGAIDTRRTIEFWTTLTGIVLIIGLIVIGVSHYRLNKKIKNLPNYSTQR